MRPEIIPPSGTNTYAEECALLGKPFFTSGHRTETPANVRLVMDATNHSTCAESGVAILIVMAMRETEEALTENDVLFAVTKHKDDFAVRRSLGEIITGKKAEGGPCFTDNERFGFERTFGFTVDEYGAFILEMAKTITEIAMLVAHRPAKRAKGRLT